MFDALLSSQAFPNHDKGLGVLRQNGSDFDYAQLDSAAHSKADGNTGVNRGAFPKGTVGVSRLMISQIDLIDVVGRQGTKGLGWSKRKLRDSAACHHERFCLQPQLRHVAIIHNE
jgi:hypothetical protein